MEYDPIKHSLGRVFNRHPLLRKVFYHLLDLLLLRTWHVHRAVRAWVRSRGKGPAAILDAGSGFGQYSYWLSGLSPDFRITAIDVKEEQVADCNAFFARIGRAERVHFAVDDLVQYHRDDHYQFILCVDVMEHVLEDEQVFRNYARSLLPGGMLLVSTPSDLGGSDVDHHSGESFIGEHVRDGYNAGEIRDKLLRAGFSRVETAYSYGWPGSLSWRLSMKYPMVWLSRSRAFFALLPFYYLLVYPLCYALNALDVRLSLERGTGLVVKAWR
jgi:SAM-dependent methyltransferase